MVKNNKISIYYPENCTGIERSQQLLNSLFRCNFFHL